MMPSSSPSTANASAELAIRPRPDEIGRASLWLERACLEQAIPAPEMNRLDVCMNEALANIMFHGGPAALSSRITLRLEVIRDDDAIEAVVTTSDYGPPFNPLALPPRIPPKTLADAESGGLGLVMIRSYADTLSYQHRDGRNQLSFCVRWAEPAAG